MIMFFFFNKICFYSIYLLKILINDWESSTWLNIKNKTNHCYVSFCLKHVFLYLSTYTFVILATLQANSLFPFVSLSIYVIIYNMK